MQLCCVNKSAMSIVNNPVQHDRTKHIEIGKQFIKDNLDRCIVLRTHPDIGFQIANIFSKRLPQDRFQDLVGKLGMINIYLPT